MHYAHSVCANCQLSRWHCNETMSIASTVPYYHEVIVCSICKNYYSSEAEMTIVLVN